MSDLYEALGLGRDATEEEIIAAGRQAQKSAHPDMGGDPAAFDRVTRALVVLRDPVKRRRYDQTGDTSDVNPEALEDMQALSVLGQQLNQILADLAISPGTNDIPALMGRGLGAGIEALKGQMLSIAAAERRVKEFRKRMSRKGDGPNRLDEILGAAEREHATRKEAVEQQRRVAEKALGMLDGYLWEMDGSPAAQDCQMYGASGPSVFSAETLQKMWRQI